MVKNILRYVKGTIVYVINYGKGREVEHLVGFSDSDHGGDKSPSEMIFYLGRNVVTWQYQKQRTVALSTCESEFMAAAACQAIWLGNLVKELTWYHIMHITLFVDNKSVIQLMKNLVFHGSSKHIDIHYHFIRECVEERHILVEHVNSKDQWASIFTKTLTYVKHDKMQNIYARHDEYWAWSIVKGEIILNWIIINTELSDSLFC